MKIKEGFLLKEVAGNFLIVPLSDSLVDLNSMVTVNETGAFLWQYLLEGETIENLVDALTSEYDIDKETAKADIEDFIKMLTDNKIISEV